MGALLFSAQFCLAKFKKTKVLKEPVESFVTFLKTQRDWYVENKRHNALV